MIKTDLELCLINHGVHYCSFNCFYENIYFLLHIEYALYRIFHTIYENIINLFYRNLFNLLYFKKNMNIVQREVKIL